MKKPPIREISLVSGTASPTVNKVKTILLLLENRERLVDLLAGYLATSGYVVLESASAAMALKHFQETHGPIDLLITDVSKPISSEADLGIRLWKCSSNLKLILLSTRPLAAWSVYNTALFLQVPKDSMRIVQEPFSLLDLLINVNELIGLPEKTVAQIASA